MGKKRKESSESDVESDGIQLEFKSLSGESLTTLCTKSSLTIGDVAKKLAERVPLPPRKMYQLFLGVELLPPDDPLSSHIKGASAELIACEDEDDSSDESGAKRKDSGKTKSNKKKKEKSKDKKSKGKNKKDKKKGSKKKKSSSSCSSSEQQKKKLKKEKVEILSKAEQTAKNDWIKERLDQLRKETTPQLPMELCLVRAQKDWEAKKEAEAKDHAENHQKNWPPMVLDAMREAEEEAKAAGKSESEVKLAGQKAAGYALKVAKDNGLYKEPEAEEDPSKVPLFFQKRVGLDKAISFLEKV